MGYSTEKHYGNTSIEFDGNDDFLEVNIDSANDDNFEFGSGDFTLDMWVRIPPKPTPTPTPTPT